VRERERESERENEQVGREEERTNEKKGDGGFVVAFADSFVCCWC
jgi:hypothetical protein